MLMFDCCAALTPSPFFDPQMYQSDCQETTTLDIERRLHPNIPTLSEQLLPPICANLQEEAPLKEQSHGVSLSRDKAQDRLVSGRA